MTTWRADRSWTGKWSIPALLEEPPTERERGGVAALVLEGWGPRRLERALCRAEHLDDVIGRSTSRAMAALGVVRRAGARVVVPSDEEYPSLLRQTAAPPLVLFVRGGRLDALTPCVAIVGARACTTGGAVFAHRLGDAIASAGFTVVSGLARGIDSAAHSGALQTGKTIGVLGTGIDVCYPNSHEALMERVVANGAIVSEFPPGAGPRGWTFPARNRVIAGMCFALIVVEAGARSGALITVQLAMDAGREIFVCITGPENPAGEGIRPLIRDGARLVIDADDAVEELIELAVQQGYAMPGEFRPRRNERSLDLEGTQRKVYDAVVEATTTEDIAELTELDASTIAVTLAELELSGLLECRFGRWRRVS
jgi:DNA processing protein